MDVDHLNAILKATTAEFRKGAEIEGTPGLVNAIKRGDDNLPGGIAEFFAMRPVTDVSAGLEKVDVEFIVVGVDRATAEHYRSDLLAILSTYPEIERLAAGPSFIEVGAVLGDQGSALRLFALGKVLGLWDVITPASLGVPEDMRREMAGQGFVMITGMATKVAP